MKTLLKIDKQIENIQTAICILLFGGILVLGSMQVFGRFIFNAAPPWTEEAMRFCGIYLTFFGSALTVRCDGHVSVDIIISFMKDNKKKAILFLISRMMCVVFLLMYLPCSIALVQRSGNFLGAAIRIPYSFIYAAVPAGIIMMLCSYASTIPKMTKQYAKGEI
ncbi:MAG: TRAP transporter small permease [Lachnospiraceae bacterium]|jgi:TRAP-type C4-dicarboxylate transport system permease small subunit|nr:TRAP transporter small permease [Lachnospiraceae bacterium]